VTGVLARHSGVTGVLARHSGVTGVLAWKFFTETHRTIKHNKDKLNTR